MCEPLLVLPRLTGRERHQAVGVGQAALDDVAAGCQAEPGVAGDPERRDHQEAERQQHEREREQRIGNRALCEPQEARGGQVAPGRVGVGAHASFIGNRGATLNRSVVGRRQRLPRTP